MERNFLEQRSESYRGVKVPQNESSTGAKVLSVDFSLLGTKVQRNEKSRYQLGYADNHLQQATGHCQPTCCEMRGT